MDDRIDVANTRLTYARLDSLLFTDRVKLVQPFNAAIIAGLAVTCWLPVALSAYLLAG